MQSLARKYRPKSLQDLVGQPSVVRILSNAFKNNKLHQAYLFSGQYGSGKTSAARILAAMQNCIQGPTIQPCGTCELCQAIFEGRHEDVKEIDAASSAGKVEQARELKAEAQYSSIDGARSKFYILDEAHRMSDAAAESLLKLIEEPPPNVYFILCTTDPHKLKSTIHSRCQPHDFRKIYWTEISRRLQDICKLESIQPEQEALNLCARVSNGSLRDALQYLEKLIMFVGDENPIITAQSAEQMLGTPSELLYYDLLDSVIIDKDGRPDVNLGIKTINKMFINGAQFDIIYQNMVKHLLDITLGLTCSNPSQFIDVSEAGLHRLKELVKACKSKAYEVTECIDNLNEAKKRIEYNMSPEEAMQVWLIQSIYSIRS